MKEKHNKYIKDTVINFDYSQLPPQALELEQAVLGAIMLDVSVPDKVMADFSPNIFYKEAHREIAQAIIELYKEGTPGDILTVTERLKKNDVLEKSGGAYYVTQLTNRVASTANVEFHIKILQQQSLKRSLLSVCGQAIQSSFQDSVDVFDLYAETQTAIDEALKNVLHYQVETVGDIHKDNVEEAIEVQKHGGISGVRSGLRAVDELTNGWQKADFVIIAGRPSMGKTAAAVTMAIHPTLAKGTPVAIFSLEMSKSQLVGRIESALSGINVSRIIKKQLTMDEITQMDSACAPLYRAPIYIDDTPNISLVELKSKARRLCRENKIELIVIDYLQLMRSGLNIGNREQEIAEISRGLKGLAKELDIPVIALSQLSRVVESRADKKPMLSDLRESGQIEQDADMVIFCYRPEYYGIESYEIGTEAFPGKGLFMFLVAKHRNGELGEIPLIFIHEQTKLINYSYLHEIQQAEEKSTAEKGNLITEKKPDEDIPF